MKSRDGEPEEGWKALVYVEAKKFARAMKFLPAVGTDTVSFPLEQVGAQIELPDLKNGIFVKPADYQNFPAVRAQLEQWAKRCYPAAATLQTLVKQLQQTETKLAAGNVLRGGKWTDAEAYQKELAALNVTLPKIPKLTIGDKSFTNASVTAVQDAQVTIQHDGGLRLVDISALTDEQIAQLNTTSKALKIVRPAK